MYKFEIICDKDLNFSDNTAAGDLFLNPKFQFIQNIKQKLEEILHFVNYTLEMNLADVK